MAVFGALPSNVPDKDGFRPEKNGIFGFAEAATASANLASCRRQSPHEWR